jgi:hypothetical protein
MTVHEGDQRETASQKGTAYSDAVIKFVDQLGYFLESRSEDSGEKEDLVFVPKAGNRDPIVAEAKYRSLDKQGISPNDYKEGFVEYFYQWEEGTYQDYEFNMFISNASNRSLWLNLFKRLNDDEIEDFFEKMKAEADEPYESFLEKHEPSRFKRFLESSVIWLNYSLADLERIANRDEEDNEYGFDPYKINFQAVPETGIHKTNLLEVATLPSELYEISAVDGLTTREFYSYDRHDTLPIHYHDGTIYSLLPPSELDEETQQMLADSDPASTSFSEFATENPSESEVDTSKVLLRGLIALIADEVGAEANRERGGTRIYMRHDSSKLDDDENRLYVQGKWITNELDTEEVRHRSVNLKLKYFSGSYFFTLYPTQEFTKDGTHLVSGSRKKHLTDRFNPGAHPQNKRKSNTVEMWLYKLGLEESLTRYGLPENLQDVQLVRVEDLVLEGIRPPNSPDERNDLITDQLDGGIDVDDLASDGEELE